MNLSIQKAMGEIKDVLNGRCKECNEFLSRQNKSGYCRRCAHLPKRVGRLCKKCKQRHIGKNNKSGYCNDCYPKLSKEEARKWAKQRYDYYYASYKKKAENRTDVVVFKDPKDPGYYHRTCWRSRCKRKFWTNNPYLRYCNDYCRTQHHNCTDEGHAHKGMTWLTRGNI